VITRLAILLIVLGAVGVIVGLIEPLNAHWALVPGVVALAIGVVLYVLFAYGWGRRHP
jgi:Flp pilus assembly protein protease CpaA